MIGKTLALYFARQFALLVIAIFVFFFFLITTMTSHTILLPVFSLQSKSSQIMIKNIFHPTAHRMTLFAILFGIILF